MRRRPFPLAVLALLTLLAASAWHTVAAQKPGGKPNIVVIVADDLGYAGISCQGCDIPTPHIDSIAKNGVRCTNGYVSCPVCSPTRAGLMTGRYQQRFGHEFNPGPAGKADKEFGLPLSEVTLADRLKAAGYRTGMVGKWHLGYTEKFYPQQRGFEEFFGFLGGAHSFLDARADKANPIMRGSKAVEEKEYLTDAFTREAVACIDKHQKEPFFLYLTYNAVHAPMHAIEKYLQRFPKLDGNRRIHAAMLVALDDGVGAVLAKLRQAGIEENTLIFFISDNGGPTQVNTSRNDPLAGRKGQVLEGGIRVPYLVQWKAKLPAGKVYDQPVIALDIHPTAVAAATGTVRTDAKFDGVNLVPYLTGGNNKPPHESLYWRFGAQSAIRQANWKLVKTGTEAPRLYDLGTDVGEAKDLAATQPQKAKELDAALKSWDSQLMEPLWRTTR